MKNTLNIMLKITIGCLLYSIGLAVFLQPNSIAPGGFSGMAVIVNFLTDIPTGTLILIFNIPISIIGYKKLGKVFMLKTIYSISVSSSLVNYFSNNLYFETEPLLGTLYGGILIGLGCGFILSVGGSSGGIDVISKVVLLKKPHLSLGQIMIYIDIFVVAIGTIVFNNVHSGLYAFISIWICSKLVDSVIEGPDLAKLIYIISDKNVEISAEICEKVKRGATLLNGTGAFTREEKNVIMCAVRREQIPKVKKIAHDIDEHAFMIVTDVREVLGDGFKHSQK